MSLMGVDIGQGGVKAAVFDQSGNLLSRVYQEYPTLFPSVGFAEIDSRKVIESGFEVIRKTALAVRKKDPIAAIAGHDQPCGGLGVGAALLVGGGAGLFDPKTMSRKWARPIRVFRPRPKYTALYEKRFALYKKIYASLSAARKIFIEESA